MRGLNRLNKNYDHAAILYLKGFGGDNKIKKEKNKF